MALVIRTYSIKGIKRLVNDGVFKTFDFMDFGSCVDCVNKPTKQSELGEVLKYQRPYNDIHRYGEIK